MTTTKRKAAVTGVAKWVGTAVNGNRLLSITPTGGREQTYEVETTGTGYNLHYVEYATGEFVCRKLERHAGGVLMCSCPDVMKGGRRAWECRHARGLAAALRKTF